MKSSDIKSKKFLEEYSNTLDIVQSAINAGYTKQTAKANALNILTSKKWQKELDVLCECKAEYLDICKAYVVKNYLKIVKWALRENDDNKLIDPTLALRALDGLVKQLIGAKADHTKEEQYFTTIKGLDVGKI